MFPKNYYSIPTRRCAKMIESGDLPNALLLSWLTFRIVWTSFVVTLKYFREKFRFLTFT